MEVNLGFNGFQGWESVFEKSIMLSESQDCVVPDTLPDIDRIVCTSGCVLVRSKDVAEGHIRMEANIPARVCCTGVEGRRFCLDVNIPFYISAEDEAIPDGSACSAGLVLKHLETRILNPRKISVRAEICASLRCYAEHSETFAVVSGEENAAVHVLEGETELTAIGCVTEKTFVLTDEYTLAPDREIPAEIIAQNADVTVQELRSIGSKMILKGCVRNEILYFTEHGALETAMFSTAFSQIIETETDTEEALCDAQMLISGMYYELVPGEDGRSISAELHLVAQIVVYTRHTIRYLSDAYCNAYPIELHRTQREFTRLGRELLLRESCNAQLDTAGEIGTVIACHVAPVGWSRSGGELTVQLLTQLVWQNGETCGSMERTVVHTFSPETGGEALHVSVVSVADVFAAPENGGAELRVSLEIRGFAVQNLTLDCISSIACDETAPLDLDDRPTLVILFAREKPDLWSLARENCSTVEAIRAANDLDGEAPESGQLLLIPKTV